MNERTRFEISLEAYREEMNVMSFYTRKGKEEGHAEGEIKGKTETTLSMIRKMLAKGMSKQEIIDLLDIDPKFFSMV